jgi:hypothetical protein
MHIAEVRPFGDLDGRSPSSATQRAVKADRQVPEVA